jgi:hypothetical protein
LGPEVSALSLGRLGPPLPALGDGSPWCFGKLKMGL